MFFGTTVMGGSGVSAQFGETVKVQTSTPVGWAGPTVAFVTGGMFFGPTLNTAVSGQWFGQTVA